jgi:predicted nucleic acid-binding protein
MILLDTDVVYALTDRRDGHHSRCRTWLTSVREPLLVPPTVVAEACCVINRELGAHAEAAFLDDVGVGLGYPYRLVEINNNDMRRMADLVRQYAGRRLGGTDASLIALSERLAVTTIATLNGHGFAHVKPRHVAVLRCVPDTIA